MKENMLYLMHIDWEWIKQRPQYIAEKMKESYNVALFYPRNYRIKTWKKQKNAKVFYSIPMVRRTKALWKVDFFRKELAIRIRIASYKPKVIYATHPEFGRMIPSSYKGIVVYDCMDDMVAFTNNRIYKERAARHEKEMVKRATYVLATSERLKAILQDRYPQSSHKLHLVRNGYDGIIAPVIPCPKQGNFTLCYFGTISRWFNFDYVLRSLDDIQDLRYLLIGPVEGGTNIPQHERLVYIPPVKHDELIKATEDANAFIMPFLLNDLILSVDPVKLYEYINFGKDILCIEYPEIERFRQFVHFYHDYSSFKEQIAIMMTREARKYTDEERIEFLSHNTWDQRANQIIALLRKTERE